jgi:hypothetical protein
MIINYNYRNNIEIKMKMRCTVAGVEPRDGILPGLGPLHARLKHGDRVNVRNTVRWYSIFFSILGSVFSYHNKPSRATEMISCRQQGKRK